MNVLLNDTTMPRLSVSSRVERLPKSSYQTFLCWLLIIAWFVEAIDLGGIAYLMPVLAKAFNLDPKTLGYLGAISFAGMFVGSIISGNLSDRFGRKKILMASMAFWGIAGVLLSMAWSIESLFVFRFLLGLGLGAQVPIGITMLSELIPSKIRGKYLALYQAFLPVGITAAGLITYLVLPKFGWQGVFFVEALPALWLFVIWKYMPESPRWLESKSKFVEADKIIGDIEKKVQKSTGGDLPPVEVLTESDHDKGPRNKGFGELATKAFLPVVVMAAIWQGSTMLGFYGLNTWLSALLVAKGFSVIKSIGFVSLIALGGLPAYFLVSYLAEKIGRKWNAAFFMIMTGIGAYIWGSATSFVFVIILGLIFQFFYYGMAMANNVYLPELWPTHLRGTGVGFGLSCGRIGALIGPILLGFVMATYGPMAVFAVAAGILVLGGVAIIVLGPETKGKVF
ncbi:MAG: MFS transporter [Clostridia bacterium]|nr:MFS transporter [Clostridia bacterium]